MPIMYCPSCGSTVAPRKKYQGSAAVAWLLGLCAIPVLFVGFLQSTGEAVAAAAFFVVWAIYMLWRHSAAKWICNACGKAGMIPMTSPAAKKKATH